MNFKTRQMFFLAIAITMFSNGVFAVDTSVYKIGIPPSENNRQTALQRPDLSLGVVMTDVHYGIASWYSQRDPFINERTANGEIFNDQSFTCASWNYPFNTYLEVMNLENRESIVCRVNDRGPAKRLGRVVDLSKAAFNQIADLRKGLIHVRIIPVYWNEPKTQ